MKCCSKQGCFCSECFAGVEHISTDLNYSLQICDVKTFVLPQKCETGFNHWPMTKPVIGYSRENTPLIFDETSSIHSYMYILRVQTNVTVKGDFNIISSWFLQKKRSGNCLLPPPSHALIYFMFLCHTLSNKYLFTSRLVPLEKKVLLMNVLQILVFLLKLSTRLLCLKKKDSTISIDGIILEVSLYCTIARERLGPFSMVVHTF